MNQNFIFVINVGISLILNKIRSLAQGKTTVKSRSKSFRRFFAMSAQEYLQSLYDVSFLKKLFNIGDMPMSIDECICFLQKRELLICELNKRGAKKIEVD